MATKDSAIVIEDLQNRLKDAEDLIEAIKAGHVDAFAIRQNGTPKVYTLQSTDYTYRMLIEKMGEGAISFTEDGLIVYCNKYFSKLIVVADNRLLGTLVSDLISDE